MFLFKSRTLKAMEVYATETIAKSPIVTPVVIRASKNHITSYNNQMVPFIALASYKLDKKGNEQTRTYLNCSSIHLCINSCYILAKKAKRDPHEYLQEVLQFLINKLSKNEDPSWVA